MKYLEATSADIYVNKLGHAKQHGAGIEDWLLTQLVVLIPLWKRMSHLQATQVHTDTAKAWSYGGLDEIKLPNEFQCYSFNNLKNGKLKLLEKTK